MNAVYIPPYSPDFNPIEEVFSWLKRRLRASGDYLLLLLFMIAKLGISLIVWT
jgi:transposase